MVSPPGKTQPTLAELGITKNESSEAQSVRACTDKGRSHLNQDRSFGNMSGVNSSTRDRNQATSISPPPVSGTR